MDLDKLPEELKSQLSKSYLSGKQEGDAARKIVAEVLDDGEPTTLDDLIIDVWARSEIIIKRDLARAIVRDMQKNGLVEKVSNRVFKKSQPKPENETGATALKPPTPIRPA